MRAFSTTRKVCRRHKPLRRLFFEPLEQRWLLSNIVVTTELDTTNNHDGLTSLREAVTQANAEGDFDTIMFDSSLADKPLLLTGGQLTILSTLTIRGLGPGQTTINGQNSARLFNVRNTAGDVTFDGLLLIGGKTTTDNEPGGGIRSDSLGLLTIQNCIISGNSTAGLGAPGGGISASGSVTVANSTIAANLTMNVSSFGGGIRAGGSVTVISSTVSGNSTAGAEAAWGGGIYGDSVTVSNSTIADNSTAGSVANGGGIYASGAVNFTNSTVIGNSVAKGDGGGAFSNNGPVTIRNSIVAGNLDSQDGSHPDLRSAGTLTVQFSLIGDNNGTGLSPAPVGSPDLNGNLIGTHIGPMNPQLGPLADNGGPARTRRPLVGSPVIDAGSNGLAVDPVSMAALSTDQRGAPFVRIVDGPDADTTASVDMGAVEFQTAAGLSLVVDTANDENDGNYAAGDVSLREAVGLAQSTDGTNTITFAPAMAGQSIRLTLGQVTINQPLTIQGLGAAQTTINGQNSSRLFDITSAAGAVTLDGLTLTGGRTNATNEQGGAIRSASTGQLTVQNCTISGNSTLGGFSGFFSGSFGGGIHASGPLAVINSTIAGNFTAGDGGLGGGISAGDSLTVTNSTISGNSTAGNSAVGGGIYAVGSVTITNSTITGNLVAKSDGSGVFSNNGPLTIRNSIVAGNLDTQDGSNPDVHSGGTLSVQFSLIGDNNGSGLTAAPVASSPNFNLIGTHSALINPRLSSLQNNGGPTLTERPLTGSPVIDAGNNSLAVEPVSTATLTTDQRGAPFARLMGGTVDMGAVESTPPTAQTLPFSQDWTDTGLITADDDWMGVPGILGFRGDGLATVADTDPQTILADGSATPVDVNANQSNPNVLTTGGVAEFDGLADPTVALQGSGTASAPFLLLYLNSTGGAGIRVHYDLRDLDSSTDNSVQPVALQYRIGSSGNFVNVPAGYVADASTGPSLADLVTAVDAVLPPDANDQPLLQVRIITSNATGADEWIGIDHIAIAATTALLPPTLPFAQDWSDTNLITVDNRWSGVPGIVGYRGDGLALAADTDPQTILADGTSTPRDVIANQTNPDTLTTGGVAEFDGLADPVAALQGSGTATAPFLLLQVNTTGSVGIRVQYDLRDIDASADNAVQQVALQYRIGSSGDFVNVPAAYVADASTGPNLASLVTPVNVVLPADANDQPLVQLRIITTNATGADEWIGIDNIAITGTPPNHAPTCTIGLPQKTTDETGLQSAPDWIINCSANDPGQNVTTISVTVDKPALFTADPAVDASGTLTYDPAPNVHDTATVTITINDDGGTAAGGSDTTTVQVAFEVVKPHRLFNADGTGARRGLDVTGSTSTTPDGFIVAGDVLAVINYINAKGSGHIPANSPFGPPFCDVTADDEVVAEDVLKIINWINAHPGASEGESGGDIVAKNSNPGIDEILMLLAPDTAAQSGHTRRRG